MSQGSARAVATERAAIDEDRAEEGEMREPRTTEKRGEQTNEDQTAGKSPATTDGMADGTTGVSEG